MKMRRAFRRFLFVALAGLGGCSTVSYLKPEASEGTYSRQHPSCPGPMEVVEFRPVAEKWIVFRVKARLLDKYNPEGTKLIAYIEKQLWLPESPRTRWSFFPSDEEKKEREKLLQQRKNQKIVITWPSSFVTVVLPDGTRTQVSLPLFEKPYIPNEDVWPNKFREGVLISPKRLETFTIIFPDMFYNGHKFGLPPVKFDIDRDTSGIVLNC